MNQLMTYQTKVDDDVIEFEVIEPQYFKETSDERLKMLEREGKLLDFAIEDIDRQIEEISGEINYLTNHSDGFDYAVAVCSGLIAGLIDSFFVGEFDFDGAKQSVNKAFDKLVLERAKNIKIEDALKEAKEKYGKKGEDLPKEVIAQIISRIEDTFNNNPNPADAIETFAKKYKIPIDFFMQGLKQDESTATFHLDELMHHPSIIGLTISILSQFTKTGFFQEQNSIPFEVDSAKHELVGKGLREKLICAVVNWLGYLINDTVSGNLDKSEAPLVKLPEPFVSVLKELGTLPVFQQNNLPDIFSYLLNNDNELLKQYRLNLGNELEIGKEIARQAIPVFVDEILVRTVYLARRFLKYGKNVTDLSEIPWKDVLPIGNRTIARMITISLGTMEVIDITDAAIRGVIEAEKAGVAGAEAGAAAGPYGAAAGAATFSTAAFWKTFALRVNYVGVGSFAVAGYVDSSMGLQRQELLSERIALYDRKIAGLNGKMYFKEAEMWVSAEEAGKSVEEAYQYIFKVKKEMKDSIARISSSLDKIEEHLKTVDEKNPGLKESMLNTLKWGL